MNIADMTERSFRVQKLYDELNHKHHGAAWNEEQLMAGFVGDVGDLSKLVMAKAGRRTLPGDIDSKLKHELMDCLWSVLVLSKVYKIDVETAFVGAMDTLEARVQTALTAENPSN